jgi:hypothetical protein
MRYLRIVGVLAVLGWCVLSASAQQWEPAFRDVWGNPFVGPLHVALDQPFDIRLAAVNTDTTTPFDLYDYDLTIDYGDALSYVPGSFEKGWDWGQWDVTVVDDPGSRTLTLSSDSPSVPWGHTLDAGRPEIDLGGLQFTALELNAKDYSVGGAPEDRRSPWTAQIVNGTVYTSDDKSTQLSASAQPQSPEIYTNGQRPLVSPSPAFGPSAARWGVSTGVKAEVENMQHFDGSSTETMTDIEEYWFDIAQAYRTDFNDQQSVYARSDLAFQDDNAVYSLETNATIADLTVVETPAERFTSTARAEILPGTKLVSLGKGGETSSGDSVLFTIAAATQLNATDPVYAVDPEGVIDWEVTVRLNAVDGPILTVLDPDNPEATFSGVIGDMLYYEGYLESQAVTGEWVYEPGSGLYGALGATAEAKLDVWTHVAVPEPAAMSVLAVGGLTVLLRRKRSAA